MYNGLYRYHTKHYTSLPTTPQTHNQTWFQSVSGAPSKSRKLQFKYSCRAHNFYIPKSLKCSKQDRRSRLITRIKITSIKAAIFTPPHVQEFYQFKSLILKKIKKKKPIVAKALYFAPAAHSSRQPPMRTVVIEAHNQPTPTCDADKSGAR